MSRFFTILLVIISARAFGQAGGISISASGTPPAASAMLDVSSSNKGFLMPRLTQGQQDSINAPEVGLMIYNTSANCFEFYTGSFWQAMVCACSVPPAAPASITGPSIFCYGQTVGYSINPIATATTYHWSVPPGATVTSGQGSTSATVTFGSQNGYVTVYALNTCGNGTADSMAVSSLGTVPGNPGLIGGTDYALNNQTGLNFAIDTVPTTFTYDWTVPVGAVITSGQGTNSLSVNFGTSSGNVCVTDSNVCGNSNTRCLNVSVISNCPVHDTANFVAVGQFQTFTVPSCVTSVTIEAWGAQGGNSSSDTGGFGADIKGTFNVNPGDVLTVGVGQQPNFNGNSGGGGGSSGVKDGGNLLLVAGGGGGAGATQVSTTYKNASAGTSGQNTYGCGNNTLVATGGSGGSGGQAGTNPCGDWPQASGGAGVNGNGGTASTENGQTSTGGLSSGPGGNGGYGSAGGFGFTGGGGGSFGGGGGGGYSGGAGGASASAGNYVPGGGGGSYNSGSNQSNNGGVQSGEGQVIISW